MRVWSRSVVGLALLACGCAAHGQPSCVRAPDDAHARLTRIYEGIPSVAVSGRNGRMWATWYAGDGEDSSNYAILATSGDGGKSWKEVLIADPDGPEGGLRAFDPEIWISPDGRLRWFWTERRVPLRKDLKKGESSCGEDSKNDALMMLELSAEDLPQGPFRPRQIERGVMMTKPVVLSDGEWMLPVARWGEHPAACFAVTRDGRDFSLRGGVDIPDDWLTYPEHAVTELKDGTLRVYIRTRRIGFSCSESRDRGRTWSAPVEAPERHCSSRFVVRRLPSGRHLMVKHGAIGEKTAKRERLTAYVSDDDCRSWKGGLLLDARVGASYPDADIAADGTIRVVYDFDRCGRREVLLATFTEQDVLSGNAPAIRRDKVAFGEVLGINGTWSPDGRRIAFQRENDDRRFEIGVLDLDSGAVEWVVRGATGTAADPAWAPDGSLVYAYTPMTNTAYVAYKTKSDEGLNLYAFRTGVTTRLTQGRWQDFTPRFAPDGKLYYASTEEGDPPKYERGGHSEIRALDPAVPFKGACVVGASQMPASGVTSPAVSPNGRFIVWAERDDFFDSWHLVGAPLDDLSRMRPMTDYGVAATSPCWTPDGRYLVYQAFAEGDEDWGIWVQEVKSGAARRMFAGEHPAVSPDGQWLLYDDTCRLHVHRLTAADLPSGVASADPWEREGTLHVTADFTVPDPKSTAKIANVGTLSAMFVRGRILARNYFKFDSPVSCLVASDRFVGGEVGKKVRVSVVQDAEHAVWVFVDGKSGRFRLPVDRTMEISPNAQGVAGEGATLVSSGAGWPQGVVRPVTRKEMAE